MKLIKTKDAVGQVLCHDITQIIRGVKKDAVFKKGHVIREEDIPVLLSVGKDNVYIWENDETMMHENDAAEVLCRICKGDNIERGVVKEGKIELRAACDGVLKINNSKMMMVNSFGDMMIASRHGNFAVKEGDVIAGTRIIPLVIEKEKMDSVAAGVGDEPIMKVIPFRKRKVGIVTTGNEVFYGRIKDTFTPVVVDKVGEFDGEVIGYKLSDDNPENIIKGIRELLDEGADMIACTGGMSVDPDDKTPYAIKVVADEVITYGAPVLPGAMFMLAYYGKDNVPIMGLPGCVMYSKRTIFDLVLPRVMIGEKLKREDFEGLGQGGLCLNCRECIFPNCGFGK